jgi:hypothetical protein
MIGGISLVYIIPMVLGSILGVIGTLITARYQARQQARQRSGEPAAADVDRLWQEMREGPRWLISELRVEIDRNKQEIGLLRSETAQLRAQVDVLVLKITHCESLLMANGIPKETWGG